MLLLNRLLYVGRWRSWGEETGQVRQRVALAQGRLQRSWTVRISLSRDSTAGRQRRLQVTTTRILLLPLLVLLLLLLLVLYCCYYYALEIEMSGLSSGASFRGLPCIHTFKYNFWINDRPWRPTHGKYSGALAARHSYRPCLLSVLPSCRFFHSGTKACCCTPSEQFWMKLHNSIVLLCKAKSARGSRRSMLRYL